MDICDRRALKEEACDALRQAPCDHKKLILIHTGIAAAVMLAVTLVNTFLDYRIADLGGLSGLGSRTLLSTVQSVLVTVSSMVLPFWEMGYLFAVLRLAGRQQASVGTLLDGFRNFGPVLRFYLIKYLLLSVIAFACYYPSVLIFMVTPMGRAWLLELAQAGSGGMMDWMPDEAALEAASEAMLPLLVIFLALYLLLAIPVLYRLRMAEFALAENPGAGAFRAIRASVKMTKRNCMKLFRVDLSFWWYFALEGLLAVLCYGDVVLPALGIRLPFSGTGAFLICYALGLAGQTALYWWRRNEVMTTYAVAYEYLKDAQEPSAPATPPKKQPWNY